MPQRKSTRQVGKAGKAAVAKKRPAKKPRSRKSSAKREPTRPGSPAIVAPGGKTKKKPGPTVVGIGASAGGFTALKEFFTHVPPDSGLAYVVVVHLSPEHESHLAPLLQPYTQLEVHQVNETVPLTANCVYVIPPNANLNTIDTHLRLSALEERRQERAPIDHFFRTLAETHDGKGIGVILTGTGSDGTRGIKEIKLRGGLTIVQDPKEAEYDGMPQSALATGFVDLVLPLAKIPGAAMRFARTEPNLPSPGDDEKLGSTHRLLLQKIFTQVRARTGRDFTRYKRSTVMRRVHRRMQLRYIEDLNRYVELLRNTPDEVLALSDDLLITVTSFFRDPKVFEALQTKVIPKLFADKQPEDEIRVWCVGCATGEEVYSVAMLMLEEAARREGLAPSLHLFASDLHDRSLEVAREGFYPGDVAAEVSPERLKRFFREEANGYRIRKELRDTVVFAPHNLLNDPPFGRLDLVLCRNLLIYLQREIQSDVLRVFHYALHPGGMLVLGTAETVDNAEYFRTFDKENSIYRRGEAQHLEPRLPVFPIVRRDKDQDGAEMVPMLPSRYQAMHQEMVMQNAAASVLVGPDGQVVHIAGDAAHFLAHPVGRMTTSAIKLVRKEFQVELISALHLVRREHRPTRSRPIAIKSNGARQQVVLHVNPATQPPSKGYSLVMFEVLAPSRAEDVAPAQRESRRMDELTTELTSTQERLQSIIEEFETNQEEMKASNEELQSTNEELRSTMEELETSKEELQSMNEELHTVNQENRNKMQELAELSGDLQNLLTSTEIATLFLDRELRILRFTTKIEDLFNIRLTDRGRPISDLTHRLGYPELRDDAELVLRRLTAIERELQDTNGRWYLTNVLPYRTSDDRIVGIVITFVDITRRKESENELARLTKTLEKRVGERTRQVRELTVSLVRAEQRERRRLSETLHDELQQLLYGVQLKLKLAREGKGSGNGAEAERHLEQAEKLLSSGTRLTRQLSIDLNPPILKNEGLLAILTWLQAHMRDLHGLDVQLESNGEIRIDDGDARVLLFQVFRELLFNVAKHSGATLAVVKLREANGELLVDIADKGKGFDVEEVLNADIRKKSLGLTSVGERIGFLGGRLEVNSQLGTGTTVTVRLPKKAKIGD